VIEKRELQEGDLVRVFVGPKQVIQHTGYLRTIAGKYAVVSFGRNSSRKPWKGLLKDVEFVHRKLEEVKR